MIFICKGDRKSSLVEGTCSFHNALLFLYPNPLQLSSPLSHSVDDITAWSSRVLEITMAGPTLEVAGGHHSPQSSLDGVKTLSLTLSAPPFWNPMSFWSKWLFLGPWLSALLTRAAVGGRYVEYWGWYTQPELQSISTLCPSWAYSCSEQNAHFLIPTSAFLWRPWLALCNAVTLYPPLISTFL